MATRTTPPTAKGNRTSGGAMADPAWATQLHSYYNVTPYWDDDSSALRDPRTSAGADKSRNY